MVADEASVARPIVTSWKWQSMATTTDIRDLMVARHAGTAYYGDAENPEWLKPFWDQRSPFLRMFDQLNLENVVELACGHGRHTEQALGQMGTVTLVDVNASNIEFCRNRFAGNRRVRYVINDGSKLNGLDDGAYTALFSYDAMVHFEATDIIAYLAEISRILRPGGRALLHYSNNSVPGINPFDDPSWRNYFSQSMMEHFALRNGLIPIEKLLIPWGGRHDLDGIILLEKDPTFTRVTGSEPAQTEPPSDNRPDAHRHRLDRAHWIYLAAAASIAAVTGCLIGLSL